MFTRKEEEAPQTKDYSSPSTPSNTSTPSAVRSTNAASYEANVISKGTHIEGDVFCEGDLKVDGEVTGKIYSKSKVTVGKGGYVDGNIGCVQAEIYGRVQGSLTVQDHLFLRSEAKMDGDVLTSHLEMEPTVKFNGKCTMQDKVTLSEPTRKGGSRPASSPQPVSNNVGNSAGKPASKPVGGSSDVKKNGEKDKVSTGMFQK